MHDKLIISHLLRSRIKLRRENTFIFYLLQLLFLYELVYLLKPVGLPMSIGRQL